MIKSDNQPIQVTMKSQDSCNKLKDDPVAMLGAISLDNVDDNIKNAQESNKSDENRKRKVLNNYDSTFEYHCKHGKSTRSNQKIIHCFSLRRKLQILLH